MKKLLALTVSHAAVAFAGFAAGIYTLPILIAPDAPTQSEVQSMAQSAEFSGNFIRTLADSDSLHWGEGKVSVGSAVISLEGSLAPGPDYKLYLSPVKF